MVVDTKHGEFHVKSMNRKPRRDYYKKVKHVFEKMDQTKLHELADEFTLIAFGDEQKAEEVLGHLSAIEEDEVLTAIILAYMGIDSGNLTGD